MENYQLGESEIVLFRTNALLPEKEQKCKNKISTELLLTNENIVLISKYKKLFQKDSVSTVIVPLESIKIYNDLPYIVKREECIELYTLNGEYFLKFEQKNQAKEFFNKIMRVTSGYSKFLRGVKKVSKEIKDMNVAFDIAHTAKKTLDFAADVVIEYAEAPKKGKVQLLGTVAKVFKKHQPQENLQIEHKTENIPAELPTLVDTTETE